MQPLRVILLLAVLVAGAPPDDNLKEIIDLRATNIADTPTDPKTIGFTDFPELHFTTSQIKFVEAEPEPSCVPCTGGRRMLFGSQPLPCC